MLCVAQGPTIEWLAVSTRQPCRVCGAVRSCRFQPSSNLVCCVNTESDWPLTNGAWLHRVVPDDVTAQGTASSAGQP
jgi:hypothetical protein